MLPDDMTNRRCWSFSDSAFQVPMIFIMCCSLLVLASDGRMCTVDMREQMMDKIRQWFVAFREQNEAFPEYP